MAQYSGGALSEGHRYVEVSKTVTQQPHPELERHIAAGQRAMKAPSDRTSAAGAAGLAGMAAGLGMSGSGKRRINRMNTAVARSQQRVTGTASAVQEARANAHGAERERAAALAEHGNARSRQAALAQWENSSRQLPHTTRIKATTGREMPTTVTKVPSRTHSVVRNALNRQAHDADATARAAGERERSELARAARAGEEHSRASQVHQRGLELQRKVVPKMKRRIGLGRGLALAGGLTAAGAAVQAERKRTVGKSLAGMKGLV